MTENPEWRREYNKRNKEHIKERMHEYNITHREQIRAQKSEYRRANQERYNTAQRKRYNTHDEGRKRHNERARELNQEKKLLALSHYSNGQLRCAYCGITDIDVLSLDHINGGGTQHRKMVTPHSYRFVIKENFPEGFQVLCFNCNWKKRLLSKQINKGEN